MSMKPGARTRPLASRICSDLEGLKLPILVMCEPVMRRFALRSGAPVPSAIWALMMTRDWSFCCEKTGEEGGKKRRQRKNEERMRITLSPKRKSIQRSGVEKIFKRLAGC